MATVPEVRGEMLVVAQRLEAGQIDPADLPTYLRRWEMDMHRRKPIQRAKPQRRGRVASEDIKRFMDANPEASYHDAANATHSTIGRVSEALIGKRT